MAEDPGMKMFETKQYFFDPNVVCSLSCTYLTNKNKLIPSVFVKLLWWLKSKFLMIGRYHYDELKNDKKGKTKYNLSLALGRWVQEVSSLIFFSSF